MSNGAVLTHQKIREALERYIETQYFSKTPLLLKAVSERLDREGILYKEPYIESSPAYKTVPDGFAKLNVSDWVKDLFLRLGKENLGVYPSPYSHQLKALQAFIDGKDVFVSTGTGSGKTECFMWPILYKLMDEAIHGRNWQNHGVRVLLMYPLNALVADQLSRLRRIFADEQGIFRQILKEMAGSARRPTFGMYTGRTPYPGAKPDIKQDRSLAENLEKILSTNETLYEKLLHEGKVPAKHDLRMWINQIRHSNHDTDPEDAELITRFEMMKQPPDILITNYSMLEYMLMRPREDNIWDTTKAWLEADEKNRLLFVIDEAHMYRGSSGGEIALLIRRLFYRLGISRDKVQFIITTASMPSTTAEDRQAVYDFAMQLTAAEEDRFIYLNGEREPLPKIVRKQLNIQALLHCDINRLDREDERLDELNRFWEQNGHISFQTWREACNWMYGHLMEYEPFCQLIRLCRGEACSIHALGKKIFPELPENDCLKAISVLLSLAPFARNDRNMVLFPARMHMLFRGIQGVYACTNPNCPGHHTDGTMTLGEVYLTDGYVTCPKCGSVVYELYNDRRCGALFLKGYIDEAERKYTGRAYLWRYPGKLQRDTLNEMHFFILPDNIMDSVWNSKFRMCYLDTVSGYIDFRDDDSKFSDSRYRKLLWSETTPKDQPNVQTFSTCPHCHHQFSSGRLTGFRTLGNQSFFNLIKAQFQEESPVPEKSKDPLNYPNQGRKVLIFSDSRQQAAKLARDMADASETTAVRQLLALAIQKMQTDQKDKAPDTTSLEDIYGYFCLEAGKNHVQFFSGNERADFRNDCQSAVDSITKSERRRRRRGAYTLAYQQMRLYDAPPQMTAYLLQQYCGSYNTLIDTAVSWLEVRGDVFDGIIGVLDQKLPEELPEDEIRDVLNAWLLYELDHHMILGTGIRSEARTAVRDIYDGYGLTDNWDFPNVIVSCMQWTPEVQAVWREAIHTNLLVRDQDTTRFFVPFYNLVPHIDKDHTWYRCKQCASITPYPLNHKCPFCGSAEISPMNDPVC